MCGIAGFSLSNNDTLDATILSRELFLGIEHRGRDASGASWFEDGTLVVQKDAMKASWFVDFLDMPTDIRNAIMHVRLGTQGSEHNNNNNHPIITGNIVGVHNGMIWNDDDLFRRMGVEDLRIAEVDTEAVFAAIAYGTEITEGDKHRLRSDTLGVLEEIEGSAAIAWQEIEGDPDELQIARINHSPVVWGQTHGGSFIFASEEKALRRAAGEAGANLEIVASLEEGDYLRVHAGMIREKQQFETGWYHGGGHNRYTSYPSTGSTGKKATTTTTTNKSTTTEADAPAFALPPVGGTNSPYSYYLNHKTLHEHFLGALDAPIGELSAEKKDKFYKDRENAIEEFCEALDVDDDEEAQDLAFDRLNELGAFHAPGDKIRTTFPGSKAGNDVEGQIWLMPAAFPDGNYVLRIQIPNDRYQGGFEPVLVERQITEFVVLP